MMGKRVGRVLLVVFMIASVCACGKKNVGSQGGLGPGGSGYAGAGGSGAGGGLGMDDARWRELGINSEAEKREFLSRAQEFENADVYFDYDAFSLSGPAKKILDEKIDFIKRYPKVKVTVEGHCDDRGTNEYNLALGERRANSAFQYMINSGVAQSNLTTVSYGEERPLATGSGEAAWAKNRRDHFVLKY